MNPALPPVHSVTVAGFEITATATHVLLRDTTLGPDSPVLAFKFRVWTAVTDAIANGLLPVCAYQPDEVQADVPEGGIALVWNALEPAGYKAADFLATLVFTADRWAEFTTAIRAAEQEDTTP